MLKITCADCLGLSQVILAQFTFEMYIAAQNRKKITKNLYFGGSRSFKVVDLNVNRKGVFNLLLVINSNLSHISHRF